MAKYADATVAGFTTYHEARGREIPGTWDDDKIEASLLVASEWIDDRYGPSFLGYKTDGFLQDREWPRTTAVVTTSIPPYIIATDEIPERVIHAVYEAAWRDGNASGSLSVDYTPNKYNRVAIDGAVSVEYASLNFASDIQMTIPVIDALLAPLLDLNSIGFAAYSGASSRV